MSKFEAYIPKQAVDVQRFGDTVTFEVPAAEIETVVRTLYADKQATLKLIDATDERAKNGCFKVWYVFGVPGKNLFIVPYIRIDEQTATFPSLVGVTIGASGY